MNNNQTENIKNELKRIAAKQTLGLPLTTHESAMLTLYGNTDAAPLGKHESAQLNALCEKTVRIKFVDGCVGVGVLYKDTLATLRQCAAYDNTNVIGYYITTETRQIHFKKSHVKNIREAQ